MSVYLIRFLFYYSNNGFLHYRPFSFAHPHPLSLSVSYFPWRPHRKNVWLFLSLYLSLSPARPLFNSPFLSQTLSFSHTPLSRSLCLSLILSGASSELILITCQVPCEFFYSLMEGSLPFLGRISPFSQASTLF